MLLMKDVEGKWESVRKVLKQHKIARLYNQIPLIIRKLGFGNCIEFENFHSSYIAILKDFNHLHYKFNLKKGTDRRYFPNLRFVALKLIEKHGGEFKIEIPFIRTRRKLGPLEKIINDCY
jgi:hypothetical protein